MTRALILCTLLSISTLFAETVYDTTYFASNGAIHTISTYEEYKIQHYLEFYTNGEEKYSVDYHYENDTLRTESLKRANGKEYAYGEYSYSDQGYTYDYYHNSGKKLYSSDYSSFGYLVQKTKLLPNGKTYWRTEYRYDTLGWLQEELYYGKKENLEATGRWRYDSSSQITTYHYELQDDSILVNQYTGDIYDEYKTFYSSNLSQKDSTQVFYDGEIVYSSHFEWNEKGYMISDKHFDKEGEQTSVGTYSFDGENYTTTYEYEYLSDSTLWETTSDYRGVTEKTTIFYAGKRSSETAYRYNDLLYTDSVLYSNADEELVALGTYTYYEPYEWVKTYLYAYPNGDTISYVEYNEDGSISKIVATEPELNAQLQKLQLTQQGNQIILTNLPGKQGEFRLTSLQGKILHRGEWQQQNSFSLETAAFAQGVYILTIHVGALRHSMPLRIQ